MDPLLRVRTTIVERQMIPPEGGIVIVGYSGGADSTALLHILTRLQNDLMLRVHAAHLHHGIRPEAEKDVVLCQSVCESLGVPLHVGRVDVPRLAQEQGLTIEEAGRHARYAFFERLADEIGAVAIATAHTRDDQIETILINLLRGTGPRGLRGMPYQRGRIIRPLLDVSREQTHAYCREQNLPTCFDYTNLDPRQLRFRVRTELLPVLYALSPTFDRHLLRLAQIIENEEAWWEAQIRELLKERDAYTLRLDFVQRLHPAVQRRLLREWLRPHLGATNLPPFEILEGIRHAVVAQRPSSWQLSDAVRLVITGESLQIRRDEPLPADYEYTIVPGSPLLLPEIGAWLELELRPCPADPHTRDRDEAWLCAEAVQGQLKVRNWRPGDRFLPLGMRMESDMQGLPRGRKVSRILIDLKIPASQRRRLPLLCDEAGILWIPGYTIAERARITPGCTQCLYARLHRNDNPTRASDL
ncbi:MAG: tRNA lysidine(34) synthetase TilS [Armatimonadota bacterium]